MTPTGSMLANLRWFLDRLDYPPTRIHVRGVWHDSTGGSAIGSPMTAQQFAMWLEAGERARRVVEEQVTCQHFRRTEEGCPDCADTGSYTRVTDVFRYPMRAAMARAGRAPVLAGRPNLAVVLHTIGRCGGDIEQAASLLARNYPVMGDPETALAHFSHALGTARTYFTDIAPTRYVRDRSEAQLDAEAGQVPLPSGLISSTIEGTTSPSTSDKGAATSAPIPPAAGAVNARGNHL